MKKFYKKDDNKLKISYEVFPPKNDTEGNKTENLILELKKLIKYNPDLISVTYGAGGSNREKSIDVVKKLLNEFKTTIIMPHFTCVCSSKDYIEAYLNEIKKLGITNILALRGDEPQDINVCYKDFSYAWELIKFIKEKSELNIAVAGYPEGHPRAKSLIDDIKNLKKKVDMGGDIIFTQLFFDNNSFFNFFELCRKNKINVPIIPGILPVTSYSQLERMIKMCHASVPKELADKLEKYKNNDNDIRKTGIDWAIKQCRELIDFKIPGLHFYTLNKADAISEILENTI